MCSIDDLMSNYKESWECYGAAQRYFTQKFSISHVQFQALTVVVIKDIGKIGKLVHWYWPVFM